MNIVSIKPIRTTSDLQNAKAELAKLIRLPHSPNRDDNIEVLTTLIEKFEEKYFPVDVSDPIAAIKYRMEEKGYTPRDIEPYIGSRARVSEVLSGKRQLSIDMIRSLHQGMGIPYEALISDRHQKIGATSVSAPTIQRLNALGFALDQDAIPAFISSSMHQSSPLLLRKTRTQRAASKIDQGALLLWQAAVVQKSHTPQAIFKPEAFDADVLRQIARLSVKSDGPKRAVRKLADFGVSLVVMPPLPGTFLDGAAMSDREGQPVIGLTLRYDRTDSFWFTLLHECAHVSLHFDSLAKGETVFIDDMEIRSEDEYEQQADLLARESLIPSDILSKITWGPNTTFEDLMMLATRARVHPSIAAGRWQRDHQNYKKFSRLIERNSIRPMFDRGRPTDS